MVTEVFIKSWGMTYLARRLALGVATGRQNAATRTVAVLCLYRLRLGGGEAMRDQGEQFW